MWSPSLVSTQPMTSSWFTPRRSCRRRTPCSGRSGQDHTVDVVVLVINGATIIPVGDPVLVLAVARAVLKSLLFREPPTSRSCNCWWYRAQAKRRVAAKICRHPANGPPRSCFWLRGCQTMPRPRVCMIGPVVCSIPLVLSKLTVTGMHPARMIIRARGAAGAGRKRGSGGRSGGDGGSGRGLGEHGAIDRVTVRRDRRRRAGHEGPQTVLRHRRGPDRER